MMNPAAEVQIDQDLVRWRRAKWVVVVGLILAGQGALLLLTPRSTEQVAPKYPPEPTVSFIRFRAPSEWLALQDSTLFASANPRGFSGLAWMKRAPRAYFSGNALPAPAFLGYSQTRFPETDQRSALSLLPNFQELPQPTAPPAAIPNPLAARSRLELEGFAGRRLVQVPPLPVQYANDAVRPSVLEALLDADGLVFSARIMRSSGSRSVDNGALELAKKVRFTPSYAGGDAQISRGKLIFDWAALEPSPTNSVPKAAR